MTTTAIELREQVERATQETAELHENMIRMREKAAYNNGYMAGMARACAVWTNACRNATVCVEPMQLPQG